MESSDFIVLKNIHKTYGKGESAFEALKGVSLRIDKGEFVALMGPSGSGKSSLANILGTLDVGSSGEYHFGDIDVFNLSHNERALLRRNYIGFIFQGFNLLPRTTALENVELPLESETRFPSKKCSSLLAYRAISGSCVTIRIVIPKL